MTEALEKREERIPEARYGGRPGYTSDQLQAFFQSFAKCLSIKKAAKECGLSKSALYARTYPTHPCYDPEFTEMVEYIRLARLADYEDKVDQIAMDDERRDQLRALEIQLKALNPEKYDRKNADGATFIREQTVNVTQHINQLESKWQARLAPAEEAVDAEVVDAD